MHLKKVLSFSLCSFKNVKYMIVSVLRFALSPIIQLADSRQIKRTSISKIFIIKYLLLYRIRGEVILNTELIKNNYII